MRVRPEIVVEGVVFLDTTTRYLIGVGLGVCFVHGPEGGRPQKVAKRLNIARGPRTDGEWT